MASNYRMLLIFKAAGFLLLRPKTYKLPLLRSTVQKAESLTITTLYKKVKVSRIIINLMFSCAVR